MFKSFHNLIKPGGWHRHDGSINSVLFIGRLNLRRPFMLQRRCSQRKLGFIELRGVMCV
jgi:hypothetical protein